MPTQHEFVKAAQKHIGKPYVYGAKGPDAFDCSGLIHAAAEEVGVWMPHGSAAQIEYCHQIPLEDGLRIAGAILWMPGHDAISIGGGGTVEARNPDLGISTFGVAGRGFVRAGLVPGVTYKEMTFTEKEPTMISPVEGRVSSSFGPRTIKGVKSVHTGLDIATGKTGVGVYAPFAGKVTAAVSTRVHDTSVIQSANAGKPRVAAHVTGNGCMVLNPDGERQLFIHMKPVVKVGDTVVKGQLLGHVDLSGYTTGPHLHFETWNARGTIQNPMIWFNAHKVVPGSKPILPTKGIETKPKSFLPLVVDGNEGHRTITESERALKTSKDYTGIIEEDSGKQAVRGLELKKGFQRFYKRRGFYSGAIDGDFVSASITAEQRCLKKAGYYDGIIEADRKEKPVRGPRQIQAVQRALNKGFYH